MATVTQLTHHRSSFSTRDDGQVENGDQLASVTESCARSFAKNAKKKCWSSGPTLPPFSTRDDGQVENDGNGGPADTPLVIVFDP